MKIWLKNIEFKLFKLLLNRYCQKELDQYSRWRTQTSFGSVFIQIDRNGDAGYYEDL